MPMPRARRGRLSMTSLIDVIFLLLLFFMLSSTFSRFGEIDLPTGGQSASSGDRPMIFVRLTSDGLTVNGREASGPDALARIGQLRGDGQLQLVLAVAGDARAQGLADSLRLLGQVPDADLVVVE